MVNNALGCDLLNFMDIFSSYNQIQMHHVEEDKMVFMAESPHNYCYKVMLFGHKNVKVIYQCLMDWILGRSMQAYINDMVVTFVTPENQCFNLKELFKTIGQYQLNPNS